MRDYDKQPSSGTMFKQILDQDDQVGYFVLGIQKNGNTKALLKELMNTAFDIFLKTN